MEPFAYSLMLSGHDSAGAWYECMLDLSFDVDALGNPTARILAYPSDDPAHGLIKHDAELAITLATALAYCADAADSLNADDAAAAPTVDAGALTPADLSRLADLKARIARGEITDTPPAA